MSKRSDNHRYCSACEGDHLINGQPCSFCWMFGCPRCGIAQPVADPFRCSTVTLGKPCGYSKRLTRAQRKAWSHPEDLAVCPRIRDGRVCGRKLRRGPRDKRRANGTKN